MKAERKKGKENERETGDTVISSKREPSSTAEVLADMLPVGRTALQHHQPGNTSATLILSGNVILTLVLLWLWRAL